MKIKGYVKHYEVQCRFYWLLIGRGFEIHCTNWRETMASTKQSAERLAKKLNLEIEWENG